MNRMPNEKNKVLCEFVNNKNERGCIEKFQSNSVQQVVQNKEIVFTKA
jgi:hypothetical protein